MYTNLITGFKKKDIIRGHIFINLITFSRFSVITQLSRNDVIDNVKVNNIKRYC